MLEYFARLFYALNTFEREGLLGVASQMWDINMDDIPMVTKKQSVNWFNVLSTPLGQPAPNYTMFVFYCLLTDLLRTELSIYSAELSHWLTVSETSIPILK